MNVVINNKNYTMPEINFNHILKVEEEGINFYQLIGNTSKISLVSVTTVMIATGCNKEEAANLVNQHVLGGGKTDELVECFVKAVTESGFIKKQLGMDKEKKVKTAPKNSQIAEIQAE